jgi:hypothetical protein
MKKKNTIAAIIFIAIVTTLALVPSLCVAKAEFTSVTFYIKSSMGPPTSLILAGDNQIITWKDKQAVSGAFLGEAPYLGDIVGVCTVERHWARHNVAGVNPWTVERMVFTSTSATFKSMTGGLTVMVTGSTAGGSRPDAIAGYNWRIISSSEGLEGLHGQGTGTWLGSGKPIKLVGEVHFAP